MARRALPEGMKRILLCSLSLLLARSAAAEEGMWPYDGLPLDRIEATYKFRPDPTWFWRLSQASLRTNHGCSASFVSDSGLILTNHHCVRGCIAKLSRAGRDLGRSGYYAKTARQELRCPSMSVSQLTNTRDVTAEVLSATAGKAKAAYQKAKVAVIAKIEKACAVDAKTRCKVVSLFEGGKYVLYTSKRFDDVRLVFAPEDAAAFFGGDLQNFSYPRYDFDVSFLRAYEDQKPVKSEHFFRINPKGAEPGELLWVSGHPYSTDRLKSVAELASLRDVILPERLFQLAELRGRLKIFAERGKEQARVAKEVLFGVENSYKAYRGRLKALSKASFFQKKVDEEADFERKVNADPELKRRYASAFVDLREAEARGLLLYPSYQVSASTGPSRLLRIARRLVRLAQEREKPNDKRLPEYTSARLPEIERELLADTPMNRELEVLLLQFYLEKAEETLGVEDPYGRALLDGRSAEVTARRLVYQSRLDRQSTRKALIKGGMRAIKRSGDPLIQRMLKLDPMARAIRKGFEDEVRSKASRAKESLAEARFKVYGQSGYPDATSSLRLSYGRIEGYAERGQQIAPFTEVSGLYKLVRKDDPFQLPRRWLSAKRHMPASTRVNFVSTHDIIGGNSGSPMVNNQGELVGLIFDGNLQSLGGAYGYDKEDNRAVSVHPAFMKAALKAVYGAHRLLKELKID